MITVNLNCWVQIWDNKDSAFPSHGGVGETHRERVIVIPPKSDDLHSCRKKIREFRRKLNYGIQGLWPLGEFHTGSFPHQIHSLNPNPNVSVCKDRTFMGVIMAK